MLFRPSITRTTWRLLDATTGIECRGRERSLPIGLARRAWNLVLKDYRRSPLLFHFDFTTADGTLVMVVNRRRTLRDVYDVQLRPSEDGRVLDWRIAAAMGVALDVLEPLTRDRLNLVEQPVHDRDDDDRCGQQQHPEDHQAGQDADPKVRLPAPVLQPSEHARTVPRTGLCEHSEKS
jgi:hypothetical protein